MGFLRMIGAVSAEEHSKTVNALATATKALEARDDEIDAAEKRIEGLLRDAATRASWNKDLTDKLAKAEAEIAALKPDAEAMRKKRKDDRERAQGKRDAAPARAPAVSIGQRSKPYVVDPKATGKPRTGIPAKVGKTASAKLSGDRPAKKAVR
jgi:peptidoglycan hydrolase CwlO-like protein